MPKRNSFDKHNPLNKANKKAPTDFKANFDAKQKKAKIGKGPVKNANATTTEIHAKMLAMPSQVSVTKASKEDRPMVTQRNLSLDELLVQAKHVTARVRQEAVNGMSEQPHRGCSR
jgi:hypothetical protein